MHHLRNKFLQTWCLKMQHEENYISDFKRHSDGYDVEWSFETPPASNTQTNKNNSTQKNTHTALSAGNSFLLFLIKILDNL